jgi:uncharacterized protein
MNVWALSDPHLSFAQSKPMHIYGEHWRNHWEKIERGWRQRVGPRDVVLVPGDISWSRGLHGALVDLEWLDRLPGKLKLIVRGNHDHWWPSSQDGRAKIPRTIKLLEGDAVEVNGTVFCGTGGWLSPEDPYYEPLDATSFAREMKALQRALEQGASLAQDGIHVLLHFPPFTSRGMPTPFDSLIRRFPVRTVTFGHFHLAEEWRHSRLGDQNGIFYTLASADYIGFEPVEIPLASYF